MSELIQLDEMTAQRDRWHHYALHLRERFARREKWLLKRNRQAYHDGMAALHNQTKNLQAAVLLAQRTRDERDRACEMAVRLEQRVADLEQELAESKSRSRSALSTPSPLADLVAEVVEAAKAWATTPVLTDLSRPAPPQDARLCAAILRYRAALGKRRADAEYRADGGG